VKHSLQDTAWRSLAALLWVVGAQGVAGAEPSWPAFPFSPKPIEAVPEMLDGREAALQDSIRRVLGEILRGPSIPPPPQEPAPILVDWLSACASFGDSLEVTSIGEKHPPPTWAAADPDGRLILPLALALAEIGRTPSALRWLVEGPVAAEETPYAALLRLELLDATGDSMGAGIFASFATPTPARTGSGPRT
jgi:hypothetical protein